MNKIHTTSISGFTSTYCEYTNNTASKYGGVVYSLGEYNGLHSALTNCTFDNNHAKLGNIVYGYSKDSIPDISNIQEINSIDKNNIVTLPTYFEIDLNTNDKISILSGETIPEGIACI